ncbi:hypothetical protein [Streptomyces sp. NPDC004528]|uniref:hypothetical protein n=1 Tax=Streptomyces sp. NPDC004528 TaxID=3154550 RepID=UPI00339FF0F8
MMEDAVAQRIRGDNPVAASKSGRCGKCEPEPKDERVLATPSQVRLIARNGLALYGLNEYALVLTSAYTGLRIGELAAVHRSQLELGDRAWSAAALCPSKPVRRRRVH